MIARVAARNIGDLSDTFPHTIALVQRNRGCQSLPTSGSIVRRGDPTQTRQPVGCRRGNRLHPFGRYLMRFSHFLVGGFSLAIATPALAQDDTAPPKAVTVSGSVGLTSDYRFRGVSQSDEQLAVQGGVTISHESGIYGGFWGSNLAGWGTFGGANMELDLIAGFKRSGRRRHARRRRHLVHVSRRLRQHRLHRALCQAVGHRRPGRADGGRRLCAQAGGARRVVRQRRRRGGRRLHRSGRQERQPLPLGRRQQRDPEHAG